MLFSNTALSFLPHSTTDTSVLLSIQVAKYKDPRDACAAIVAESYRRWLQFETRTDDITVIVVHVNGLNDVRRDFTALCHLHYDPNVSVFISYFYKLLLITSCLL